MEGLRAQRLRGWALSSLALSSAVILVLWTLSSSSTQPQELVTYDRFGIPEDEGAEGHGAEGQGAKARGHKVKELEKADRRILNTVSELAHKVDAIASEIPKMEQAFSAKAAQARRVQKSERLHHWLQQSVRMAHLGSRDGAAGIAAAATQHLSHSPPKSVGAEAGKSSRADRLSDQVKSLMALEAKIGHVISLVEREQKGATDAEGRSGASVMPRGSSGASARAEREAQRSVQAQLIEGNKILKGFENERGAKLHKEAMNSDWFKDLVDLTREAMEQNEKEESKRHHQLSRKPAEQKKAHRGRLHETIAKSESQPRALRTGYQASPMSAEVQRAQEKIKAQERLAFKKNEERKMREEKYEERHRNGKSVSAVRHAVSEPEVDIQQPMTRFTARPATPIESVWHVVKESQPVTEQWKTQGATGKHKVVSPSPKKAPMQPLNKQVAVLQSRVDRLDEQEQSFLDHLTEIKDDKESAKAAVDDTQQTLRIAKDRVVLAQKEFDQDAVGAGEGDVDLDNRSLQEAKHTEAVVSRHLKDELHQLAEARRRANQGAELARQLHMARTELKSAMQKQKEQSELRLARGIELKKNFAG